MNLYKKIAARLRPLFVKHIFIFYYNLFIHRRKIRNPLLHTVIKDEFHKLYYDSYDRTWLNTFWSGISVHKCPLDLWIYQEIIFKIKPDIIIETGTGGAGSTLFLASICDLINKGKVFTIDIKNKQNKPNHKRINYLLGSSISPKIINYLIKKIKKNNKVIVILDSDHRKEHVLKELRSYSKLVSIGSYLIIEDTNINGNPVISASAHGKEYGPMEALQEFLSENKNFIIDKKREKFYLSFNPNGYLLKIK